MRETRRAACVKQLALLALVNEVGNELRVVRLEGLVVVVLRPKEGDGSTERDEEAS